MQAGAETLHGKRVAYRRAGSGPTIVLIHGITNSGRSWEPAMRLLARDFDVIAPDLPGHGDSDRQRGDHSLGGHACVLRDLLHVLEVERATVVGHSLGGGIAMQFSYQFPEMVERLVLVGAFDSVHGMGAGHGGPGLGSRGRLTRRDLLLHVAELDRWTRAAATGPRAERAGAR